MSNHKQKEQMNIVIAGHVDHGKSTVIGRLLADTGSLPEGKLEQVKENCKINSKPFEYAFLIDALKDEQSQGITIDSARVFFNTKKRNYIIIDAPGHIEFLKNMISGASRAEAALLVIAAEEGVQENSRRHGYMLSMLGIKQIAVVVNKMDLINYDESIFNQIEKEYTAYLKEIGVTPSLFIPVSGMEGDNIASLSKSIPWYNKKTVLEQLDLFRKEKPLPDMPFRMPVQDVYKFTREGDQRRIIAGSIDSGKIQVGSEIVFYPSGKRSRIKSIEGFNEKEHNLAISGKATGFTLEEQIYVNRGEIAALNGETPPEVRKKIRASIFWLGRNPMVLNKEYFFKLGTAKILAKLEHIDKVLNADNLKQDEKRKEIRRHEVAECILKLNRPLAFDINSVLPITSRFVIVDDYEISGGGIITEKVDDELSDLRNKVILRNYKWEKSTISYEKRSEKYNQKPTLIVISGPKNSGKKEVAKALEAQLFGDGKIVYFLGIGSLLYGVDADIKKNGKNREEHIRRLAEVAHILLDAGAILIVTAIELNQFDQEILKTTITPEKIISVWVGDELNNDFLYDLKVPGKEDIDASVDKLKNQLYELGIIFKPW